MFPAIWLLSLLSLKVFCYYYIDLRISLFLNDCNQWSLIDVSFHRKLNNHRFFHPRFGSCTRRLAASRPKKKTRCCSWWPLRWMHFRGVRFMLEAAVNFLCQKCSWFQQLTLSFAPCTKHHAPCICVTSLSMHFAYVLILSVWCSFEYLGPPMSMAPLQAVGPPPVCLNLNPSWKMPLGLFGLFLPPFLMRNTHRDSFSIEIQRVDPPPRLCDPTWSPQTALGPPGLGQQHGGLVQYTHSPPRRLYPPANSSSPFQCDHWGMWTDVFFWVSTPSLSQGAESTELPPPPACSDHSFDAIKHPLSTWGFLFPSSFLS